jgi:hypothetical protein
MTVYILKADANHFQGLVADSRTWREVFSHFDGQSLADSWVEPEVTVFEGDLEKHLPAGDFPSLIGVIPVFSEKAALALRDVLEGHGEVLPLSCDFANYYAFNVTRVIPALDEAASRFRRFSDGLTSAILSYEFQSDVIRDVAIFKMPYVHKSLVYVTDPFVDRVQQVGLTGFVFQRA